MKALVHVGMPKAGSTSVQLALRRNSDALLQRYGVYSEPGTGEINDWPLYNYLISGSTAAVEDYVGRKLEAGRKIGAELVIFSAERLFALPEIVPQMGLLLDALERKSAQVEVAVVVRSLRDFLNSYIKQLIANSSLVLDDKYLASWIIFQLKAVIGLPSTVKLVSMESESRDGRLVSNFLSRILGRDVEIAELRENVSSRRPFWFISMLGHSCKFRAALMERDINSLEVDEYRISFEEKFDAIVAQQKFDTISAQQESDLDSFLKTVDSILVDEIENYISTSINAVTPDDLHLYNEICNSPLSVFERGLRVRS